MTISKDTPYTVDDVKILIEHIIYMFRPCCYIIQLIECPGNYVFANDYDNTILLPYRTTYKEHLCACCDKVTDLRFDCHCCKDWFDGVVK